MHSSIIWLTLFALALIGLMLTCFVYFIRSRRKEDEEFMQQVQFTQRQQQQQQQQHNNFINSANCQQQQQQLAGAQTPSSQQQSEQMIVMNNSANNSNSAHQRRQQQQQQQQQQQSSGELVGSPTSDELAAYQLGYSTHPAPPDASPNIVSNSYAAAYAAAAASPYHNQSALGAQPGGGSSRNEVRCDITQQINSAIIGSADAEFQNDFIQVFPMYQIAPQPEKNTTPYLT